MNEERDELRWDVVRELRRMFVRGASVGDLIFFIQSNLGLGKDQRLFVFRYLAESFKVPLPLLLRIGGWEGFEGGTETDKYIEEIIRPAIVAAEREWMNDSARTD